MAKDLGVTVKDLVRDDSLRKRIDKQRYVTGTVGLPTLNDILAELAKPGRDPREQFEVFQFADGVNKLEDVKPGMKLPGIVTNVTAFGAFVDIGVHQDGLVHISQLADRFVKDANEVVKVQQRRRGDGPGGGPAPQADRPVDEEGDGRGGAAVRGGPRTAPVNQTPGPRNTPAPAGKPRRPQPAAEGWLTAALRQSGKS